VIRLGNRLLMLIFGFALAGGGALVIIEGVWTWTNSGFVWIPGDAWLSTFKTTLWSAPIVIGVSIGVGALGLAIVLLQLRRHPKLTMAYATDKPGEWHLVRRSTEAHLERRLRAEVPTSPIKAHLVTHTRKWSLNVRAKAAASTRPMIEEAARAELDVLQAPKASRIKVKTTGASKVSAGADKS
jgi:hypothetical protein